MQTKVVRWRAMADAERDVDVLAIFDRNALTLESRSSRTAAWLAELCAFVWRSRPRGGLETCV